MSQTITKNIIPFRRHPKVERVTLHSSGGSNEPHLNALRELADREGTTVSVLLSKMAYFKPAPVFELIQCPENSSPHFHEIYKTISFAQKSTEQC